MDNSFFEKLIRSPLTLIIGVVLLIAVLYNIWIVTSRLLTLHFETVNLEAKIAEIQKSIDKYTYILDNAPPPPKEGSRLSLFWPRLLS